ncbi:MAG: diacylglycerol kinase family lipid kinase [Anaerolineae bacterium]|jgi:YegS/Rv2252/BmrU family lipid kinase
MGSIDGICRVILNPAAGHGYGARVEPKIRQGLEAEGIDFDIVRTDGPWHAAELAERACADGCEMIIAAGGDGTVNEIINGFMRASEGTGRRRLGIIPAGSGSDFATGIGLPTDLHEACEQIASGRTMTVDIGRVSVPGREPRYFGNVVGVGFDGAVLVETLKMKQLRGLALYLPAVLKTIFMNFKAPRMTIEYDGEKMEKPAMLVSIANGFREGGGFLIAPDAKPDDGLFDVVIADEVSQLTMLRLIPHFLRGTHVDLDPITIVQAKQVTVSSPDGLIAHVDGEVLCTSAPSIRCEMLPGALEVCGWCTTPDSTA